MKLKIQFGLNEPPREANWWQSIQSFPNLVLFKNIKWEFFMYQEDTTKQVDYICYFSEVKIYVPNFSATTYENIDHLFNTGYGPKCDCGAIYTSFPWDHMKMCPKWTKW